MRKISMIAGYCILFILGNLLAYLIIPNNDLPDGLRKDENIEIQKQQNEYSDELGKMSIEVYKSMIDTESETLGDLYIEPSDLEESEELSDSSEKLVAETDLAEEKNESIEFVEEKDNDTVATNPPEVKAELPEWEDIKEDDNVNVNIEAGDTEEKVTGSASGRIFIMNVDQILEDYPLNAAEELVRKISSPIISIYGNDDYIYELTEYKNQDRKSTFLLTAEDKQQFVVSINESDSGEFRVEVSKYGKEKK